MSFESKTSGTPSQLSENHNAESIKVSGFSETELESLKGLQESFGISLDGREDLMRICIENRGLQGELLEALNDPEKNNKEKSETIRELVQKAKLGDHNESDSMAA